MSEDLEDLLVKTKVDNARATLALRNILADKSKSESIELIAQSTLDTMSQSYDQDEVIQLEYCIEIGNTLAMTVMDYLGIDLLDDDDAIYSILEATDALQQHNRGN